MKLAEIQTRRAGSIVLAAYLLGAAAIPWVMDLGLDSRFEALLPTDKPSVRDLEQLGDRIGGLQTLVVAIQSDDLEAMQRFTRDLAPALEALDPEIVRNVEWTVEPFERFVTQHRHFYADLDDLEYARDALEERIEFERADANPFFVRLDDEEPPSLDEVVERFQPKVAEGREQLEQYPGGFFVHPDRDLLVMFVRVNLKGGDVENTAWLRQAIRSAAADLDPASYADDLRLDFAGSLIISTQEHQALASEMITAVSITIVLVFFAILVFFRRPRSVVLLGLTLIPPVLITFGIGEITVDYLNTSTVFLGSIVIGNGVNPNIIWLARYFEARRGGADVRNGIEEAHRGTWIATLVASLAAGLAYGSLVLTDFRGFRDFGIIGGVGMLFAWLAAYLLLPSLCALYERWRPLRLEEQSTPIYGRVLGWLVDRRPTAVLVTSGLLTLTVLGFGVYAVAIRWDPIEYDFKQLRSEREDEDSVARRLNGRINEMLDSSRQGKRVVAVTDDIELVAPYVAELRRRATDEDAPWGGVQSIADLLPPDQEAKLPVLRELRELMLEARERANEEQRAQLDEHLPPESLAVVTVDDLPEDIARPFSERDGTRGRIVVIEKLDSESMWDGRYLVRWSRALREVELADGTKPPLAGRAMVFADIIEAIGIDGPKAIAASFLATLILVLLAFRRLRDRVLTVGSLLLGILWMAGLMALLGMRLNFLNFVAFPITFGNGVDYGVNVMRRFALEEARGESILGAVRETGGAVVLCSLTTIIGYISLYASSNLALNSFGLAMAISEITCVFAALLTVPAILVLMERRRGATEEARAST